MTKIKDTPPPKTEILSETKRESTPESQTSPNSGLADISQSGSELGPETVQDPTQTVAEPGFTIDEPSQQPPPDQEPTGDPLQDTQRAFHEAREEIKEKDERIKRLEELMSTVVANNQFTRQQAPAPPPPEMQALFNPEPTEDERIDPIRYIQRREKALKVERQIENTIREMTDFQNRHPDWPKHKSKMDKVAAEEPWIISGPGGLERAFHRARELDELEGLRSKVKTQTDQAYQAGAQAQRQKGPPAFVSPGANRIPGSVARDELGRPLPPADFHKWDSNAQYQWLDRNGYIKHE